MTRVTMMPSSHVTATVPPVQASSSSRYPKLATTVWEPLVRAVYIYTCAGESSVLKAGYPGVPCYIHVHVVRLFVWAKVGWVTLRFYSFWFFKASVLCMCAIFLTSSIFPSCSYLLRFSPLCSYLLRFSPLCSYLLRFSPLCSYLLRFSPLCSYLLRFSPLLCCSSLGEQATEGDD